MIVYQKTEKSDKQLLLNPEAKLFRDKNYYIGLSVCGNVQCDCGYALLYIKNEASLTNNLIECKIPIDVKDLIVDGESEDFEYISEKYENIAEIFANGFTRSDWFLLREKYLEEKLSLINDVEVEKISYKFAKSEIEDISSMMNYRDLFPYSRHYLKAEDKTYFLADTYCKNDECDCTNSILTFIELENNKLEEALVGQLRFNYKTRMLEVESGDRQTLVLLLKKFESKYPTLISKLSKRNLQIRALFKKERKKLSVARINRSVQNKGLKRNLGRNDLCYCGSGKKYKKCCINK